MARYSSKPLSSANFSLKELNLTLELHRAGHQPNWLGLDHRRVVSTSYRRETFDTDCMLG